MEKLKRAVFFWFLVIIFILIAPVIVMRAKGYRFDFHRGVFVYSGTITFKSNPQDIAVTLNGKKDESKKLDKINSSYNVSGLLPGTYEMAVTGNDFQAWSKKFDVHSGVSTEFWNVLLARKNYEKTEYDATGIDKYYISRGNKYIAYTQELEKALVLKILNVKNNQNPTIINFPDWKFVEDEKKENIEWSPDEDFLSLPVKNEASEENPTNLGSPDRTGAKMTNKQVTTPKKTETIYNYFIINASDNTFFNLNEFLGKTDIREVRWDPHENDHLFFLEGNNLMRASILDKDQVELYATDVAAYDLSKDKYFFSQSPNGFVYQSDFDPNAEKIQITRSIPEGFSGNVAKLVVYDEKRIAFLDDKKNLFIRNEGEHESHFKLLGRDIDGFHFSDDGKKLLFFSPHEIMVYFIRDWDVQPIRAEDELQEITRYSEKIDNVQWFWDYEHVIFNVGKYAKIIELDARDRRISMDLFNTELENPFVRYSAVQEKIYFTDKNGFSTKLYSIDFPEPNGLLGF
jgi:hypothetical protein